MKWYEAVGIAKEVQTLGKGSTLLRNAYIFFNFSSSYKAIFFEKKKLSKQKRRNIRYFVEEKQQQPTSDGFQKN